MMSGQLVGEVLAASPALQARGLSERGFHALVAIAEKCQTRSRQGSVRWDHIRAGLYGASLSTAKRAIADLKSAGVVRVVKRGFDNQQGRVCAPIYEIEPLDEQVTQVTQSVEGERITQVTPSVDSEQITQVTRSPRGRTDQTGGRTGQIRNRTGHVGDLLDGSIDVSIDEREARADTREPLNAAAVPTPGDALSAQNLIEEQTNTAGIDGTELIGWIVDDPEPPYYCPQHPCGTHLACGGCKIARLNHEAWATRERTRRMTAINFDTDTHGNHRAAIRACKLCDDHGWRLGPDRTPLDPAVKCDHKDPS